MSCSSRVKCLIFHPFLRHFSWTWEWNNCHLFFSLFLSVVALLLCFIFWLLSVGCVSRQNGDSSIFSGGRIYFSGNLLVDFMMKFFFAPSRLTANFRAAENRSEIGVKKGTRLETRNAFKSQNADVEELSRRLCSLATTTHVQSNLHNFFLLQSSRRLKKEKFSFQAAFLTSLCGIRKQNLGLSMQCDMWKEKMQLVCKTSACTLFENYLKCRI